MISQRWMSQNFFTFFLTWGIFLPYWSGFLVAVKNISVAEVGLIMSLGLVARGCSTMFIFPYISKKWSGKTVLNFLAVGSVIAALLYIPATSYTAILIITMLFNLFYPALMPALDSVAGILAQHGQLHYGKSRSYGSIGFIVMVFIISVVTAAVGDVAILYLLIGVLLCLAILTSMNAPAVLTKAPEQLSDERTSMLSLFKTKHFTIIIIIGFLMQGAHAAYYNYGYIYLQYLDVPKYYIGLIINIGVLFEILFFAKADHLFRRWSPAKLFALAATGSPVRWLLVALVPNIAVFIVSQSLHAFSFAMAHYAVVQFFTRNLPQQQIANAQGMYNALAMSWSTAALTILGGWLYEIEPRYAFLGMIVCTIPAILLSLYVHRQQTKQLVHSMEQLET